MLKFDWNMLWTVINLIIFFVLMKVFLFKPIKKTMEKRQELIQKQFKDAADTQAAADEKMADYEKRIANADDEAKKIVDDAKVSAKAEYGKIIDRATVDAARMKKDAQKQIDAEIQSARRSAKEDIASLAMEAAEKVVKKSLSKEDHLALINESISMFKEV